jgi:hypothetical protein
VRVRKQPLVVFTVAQVMVVVLQSSVAVTLLVLVSHTGMLTGLHPRFVLAGHLVNTGGVVSTTVMIWSHVAELLQASVARHVRVILELVGQTPAVVASLKVIITVLQVSDAVATPVKLVVVWPQIVVTFVGQVIVGGVVSAVQVMTCVQLVLLLPQVSVAM